MKWIESSDQVLIKQIRKDNRLAFDAIFERYWDYLYQASFKFLKDEEACKDIVQDVFFDFWTRRKYHEIDNLAGYLYQAVRYQSLKYIRHNKTQSINIEEHFLMSSNNTQEYIDYQQLQDNLKQSLAQLPEKYQLVFEMSRFQNLSHQEIATHFKISTRTVEWYIHIALKHLKTTLTALLLIMLY